MHKIQTTLTESGLLILKDIPFNAGDTVEVIIVKNTEKKLNLTSDSLKGKVIKYEEPFESAVDSNDWEVLK